MIYLVSKAANLIPELRQRNIGNDVYEYEVVHPSFTLLTDENQLNFCCSEFTPDAPTFINKTSELVVAAKAANEFHLDPPRHDLLFITCLPWIHFTALSHPVPHPATDSFPRIGWGRYTECGTKTTISLNIQVNHGLVDGYHISQFINGLEEYCSNPVTAFEGGLGEGAETTKDFLVL